MHLLHCSLATNSDQLNITLCEYPPEEVQYAILSHRWGRAEDEVSYRDLTGDTYRYRQKKGYEKIEACCRQALRDGFSFVWIDTCCIDKSSSSELSEAINSMYEWYKKSGVCYAYLNDVKSDEDHSKSYSTFRSSQWFTRGWTLQEMVAPSDVIFYATDWNKIGRKSQLSNLLYDVTKVTESVLLRPQETLPQVCISQIMYWASSRRTTRKEDRAYSLLGLFRINIPILYGEGDSAFMRLQEELIRYRCDHTIFAWHLRSHCSGLLADSPDAFIHSGKVRKLPLRHFMKRGKPGELIYTMSHLGLEIMLPYCKLYGRLDLYAVIIACFINNEANKIHLLLRRHYGGEDDQYFRTRLPGGSVSSQRKSNGNIKFDRKKFWIVQPDVEWQKVVRPLAQGNFTERKVFGERKIEYFWIKVELVTKTIQPVLHAAYPMPSLRYEYVAHGSSHTGFGIETEAGVVWVSSIFSDGYLRASNGRVNILSAVIDKELICHMEFNTDSTDGTIYNFEDSVKFYVKCANSPDHPCTFIDRLPAQKESADIHNTIIYMEKSSETLYQKKLKCFKVKIRFAKKRNETEFKKAQSGWKNRTPEKSLKELLASCKPITAHLTEENYNEASAIFRFAGKTIGLHESDPDKF